MDSNSGNEISLEARVREARGGAPGRIFGLPVSRSSTGGE